MAAETPAGAKVGTCSPLLRDGRQNVLDGPKREAA